MVFSKSQQKQLDKLHLIKVSSQKYEDIARYCEIFTGGNSSVSLKSTPLQRRKKKWKHYWREERLKKWNDDQEIPSKRGQQQKPTAAYWSKLIKLIRYFDGTGKDQTLEKFFVKRGKLKKDNPSFKTRLLIHFKVTDEDNIKNQYIFTIVHPNDKGTLITSCFKNQLTGCFRGRDAIWKTLRSAYVGISKSDVSKVLREQESKQITSKEIANQIAAEEIIVKSPNHYWQVDVTTFKANFPGTKKRDGKTPMRSLLVVIDMFTKFVWTFQIRLKSKNTKEYEQYDVVKALRGLMMREGAPHTLHGDNAFSSIDIFELCQTFGTNLQVGTPYMSTDQAAVERVHRTLKDQIAFFMWDGLLKNWESFIEDITFAYNNHAHSYNDERRPSPFELYRNIDKRFNQNRMMNQQQTYKMISNSIKKPKADFVYYSKPQEIHLPVEIQATPTPAIRFDDDNDESDSKRAPEKKLNVPAESFRSVKQFLSGDAIFPIKTIVCFHDNDGFFHAHVKGLKDRGPDTIYSVLLVSVPDSKTKRNADFVSSQFHEGVMRALRLTIFNSTLRSVEPTNTSNTSLCHLYSAITYGSPYQEDFGTLLKNPNKQVFTENGVPFSQNVIASTLFYLFPYGKHKEKRKTLLSLKRTHETIVNEDSINELIINECDERRLLQKHKGKDFWDTNGKSKNKWRFGKDGWLPHAEDYIHGDNESLQEIEKHFLENCKWKMDNKWTPSKYKIVRVRLDGPVDSNDARNRPIKQVNSFRWDVNRMDLLPDILWATNEFLRKMSKSANEEISNNDESILKSIKSFLEVLVKRDLKRSKKEGRHVKREVSDFRFPALPFHDRYSMYAFSPFENLLFDYNDDKDTKNNICYDTLIFFLMNFYDWISILAKFNIYIEEQHVQYFEYDFSQYDALFRERVESQRGRGAPLPQNGEIINEAGDLESQTLEKINKELYLSRLKERAKKIKKQEKLIAKKYPVSVGDIVRLKNVYRTEMAKKAPVNKGDVTIGRLFAKKEKSAVKSADPDKLDPYNIKAKWSRGLFFVFEIGRVIDFVNESDEKKHVFIPMKRLENFDFTDSSLEMETVCGSDELGQFLQNICSKNFKPDYEVNMTARIRYRVAKISDKFMKSVSNKVIRNGVLNIKKLKREIETFRKKHTDKFYSFNDQNDPRPVPNPKGLLGARREAVKKKLQENLPIMYNVKEKMSDNGVILRGRNFTMDFDTTKIRNLYRKNIRAVKGELRLRSSSVQ